MKTEYCESLREGLYLLSYGKSECFMRTIKIKRPWLPRVHVDNRAELHELPSLVCIKAFEFSSEYVSDLKENRCTCYLKLMVWSRA